MAQTAGEQSEQKESWNDRKVEKTTGKTEMAGKPERLEKLELQEWSLGG